MRVTQTVAQIGIGLLGCALAERLLAAGYSVRGYDPDPQRMAHFQALGGAAAESPADAARGADVVLTCLLSGEVVRQAVLGPEGAAHGMACGSLLVDTSTCAPAQARALARELQQRGIAAVDATVSGSSAQARAGQAVALVGGDAQSVARCLPLLETFCHKVFHLGGHGAGATAKLVTNLVLGLNRLALAEGLTLGLAAGLAPEALLDVLRASAAYSKVMDTKGERMITGCFQAEARLSQHLKDVGLILELGAELGVPLPASELHRRLLQRGVEMGLGELDNSAIIAVLRLTAEGDVMG